MSAHWWWWGLAVILGACELGTGTLYLLVLGVGAAIAGLAALLGAPAWLQFLVAAITALAGWAALRRFVRPRQPVTLQANQDIQMDIGGRVRVEHWQTGGTARVHYRGATWEAVIDPAHQDSAVPGEFRICAVDGNRLVLAPPR